ncbi:type V toxin-antitoxin system endoribonuclease antitoxin GhoS [Cronobacter sakazakii]
MTSYTVRVELHDADGGDYDDLHDEMAKQGFSKTIILNGVEHDLPTAEYSLIEEGTTSTAVLRRAVAAANVVQPYPKPSIVVTETDKPRMTSGLPKTK